MNKFTAIHIYMNICMFIEFACISAGVGVYCGKLLTYNSRNMVYAHFKAKKGYRK